MVGAHILITGKVQGVGFRYFAKNLAIMYNIRGWVTNNFDGSVEFDVEGKKEKIGFFLEKLKTDHPYSTVKKINIEWFPAKNNYPEFYIKY